MTIRIGKVKEIREELDLSHIVIFGISFDGSQQVATHGKTKVNAKEAANAGNKLKSSLGWPDNLCHSKPLERICGNCSFWKMKKIEPGDRIPKPWPGFCYYEPTKVQRFEDDIACGHFEPNC